jgi:hypothetical protein
MSDTTHKNALSIRTEGPRVMNCETCINFREGPPVKGSNPFKSKDGVCLLPIKYITSIELRVPTSWNSGNAWMAVEKDYFCKEYNER